MYEIKKYSYDKINELNKKLNTNSFFIKPSTTKKIRVYKNNKLISEIGEMGMSDYPTYIETDGIDFANTRRIAFYNRFKSIPNIKDGELTNMFWARYLLW